MVSLPQSNGKSIEINKNDLALKKMPALLPATSVVIYKHANSGPVSFGDIDLFCNTTGEANILEFGSILMVSIGQGDKYHTGLFGPLPVLGTNYQCLVQAINVDGKNRGLYQQKSKNYLLACFFYPVEIKQEVKRKRNELEKEMGRFFRKNRGMKEIEKKWPVLKKELRKVLLNN